MHIDGWDCLNSKHEQMRKIMISSHHKVRFELVVPTNDWILVVSLLHHFVLTLPPSLTSGDVIRWLRETEETTATPTHHWVTNDHNCVWMSSSSRWRNTMHHPHIVTSTHLSPCALDCLLVSPEPVLARLAKVLSRSFPPGEGDLKIHVRCQEYCQK